MPSLASIGNRWIRSAAVGTLGLAALVGVFGRSSQGDEPASSKSAAPRLLVVPFGGDAVKAAQLEWSKRLGAPVEATNQLGMKLVLIPPGEFQMGSLASHNEEELPRHRVRITRPFYLGKYEVTQGEYERVMAENRSTFAPNGLGKDRVAGANTNQHPAEMVSWFKAREFCKRLGQQEGAAYRLPTEAEWEYACRAGSDGDFGSPATEENMATFAWCSANADEKTHSVGTRLPSQFGLHDMQGNVAEWCSDWFGPKYYLASPIDDPTGPETGAERVVRGGDWFVGAAGLRSALRNGYTPTSEGGVTGFRVVRELAVEPPKK